MGVYRYSSSTSSPLAFRADMIVDTRSGSIGGSTAVSKPNCRGMAGCTQMVVRASSASAPRTHVMRKLSLRRSFVPMMILRCASVTSSMVIGAEVPSYFSRPILG